MLEEAADDGANPDSLREALDAGAQDRKAADNQVDLDARLRGLVKSLDDRGLEQRVHLGHDVSGAPGLGVLLFAADQPEEALGHGQGRHQQRLVVVHFGVGGQVVGQLAVRLQADDAVEDLHAGVLHRACPADVRGLVEAGHQLDDQRGLLGGRGLDQRPEDGRVLAGAIQGLLDADHQGVFGALLNEIDHRVVGVVGVVEQNVVLLQLTENIGAAAAQFQGPGREGGELQVGPRDVAVKKDQAREVHRAVAADDLILVQLEVDLQPLDDLRVGAGLDLQAHGVALAAVVQFGANGLQQRTGLFLLEVEVGVAGDAEGGAGQHLVAAVHAGQILRDQILQQQVIEGSLGRGQADEPGQGARHRDHPQHLRAGTAPLASEQESQAESLVQNARKGMGRIDRDGRQQRVNLLLEVILGKVAGLWVQLPPFQQANALLAQFGQQVLVPALVLVVHKAVDLGVQHGERLFGAQAVVAGLAVAVFDALHQAGLADFNVLVEIRGGDGQKLDPFQQRIGQVLGLFEHTPVELHPGVVPSVEQLLLLRNFGHRVRVFRAL